MAYQLAIDVGNTRTKFGLFESRELLHEVKVKNTDLKNNNQIFSEFKVERVILSSVNTEAEQAMQLEELNLPILNLTATTPLPIHLAYESPETLGKDRIAAVVGAESIIPGRNLLVIDAGSCITYDFLTSGKEYLGGAISPGVQMRLRSMNDFTNQLPLINWTGEQRPKSIGSTTISSMLSGVVNGLIAEMNGFIESYEKQYNNLKIVITGGDANFFEKELKNGIFADPNLVLIGLNEILIYNRE